MVFDIMFSENMYAEKEMLKAKWKTTIINILFLPTALINCSGLFPVALFPW